MSESKTFEEIAKIWRTDYPRPRAIIVDIDETICTQFDIPVKEAIRVLAQLDRSIVVHYVTARPEASRSGTESFLLDHRLPGWKNLHFCPSWKSTFQHKLDVMVSLTREYKVLVSIGDTEEDGKASQQAGIPFVRVDGDNPSLAWDTIMSMVTSDLPNPTTEHS